MGKEDEKRSDLEINEDPEHHVRAWRFKRVGWAIMFLVIVAAFAGFLGPGPYSRATAQGTGGLNLKYERISRYNAPTHFRLTVPAGKETIDLSLNVEFLRKIDIERIDPEPKEMRLEGENEVWIFEQGETKEPSEIRISFRPESFGSAPARLAVRDVGLLEVKPFFMP